MKNSSKTNQENQRNAPKPYACVVEFFSGAAILLASPKFSINSPESNIPKFKDRANWSRDTFQPMRRRACVYQQTNQNIAPSSFY